MTVHGKLQGMNSFSPLTLYRRNCFCYWICEAGFHTRYNFIRIGWHVLKGTGPIFLIAVQHYMNKLISHHWTIKILLQTMTDATIKTTAIVKDSCGIKFSSLNWETIWMKQTKKKTTGNYMLGEKSCCMNQLQLEPFPCPFSSKICSKDWTVLWNRC